MDTYKWKDICQIFNWNPRSTRNNPELRIIFADCRGIELKYIGDDFYTIEKEKVPREGWVASDRYPKMLFHKEGYIKGKTGRLVGYKDKQGYVEVTVDGRYLYAHRMLMEVFCPLPGMEKMMIDHIDGCRDNNNIDNLRWVTPAENILYKEDNWNLIKDNVNLAIQKFGYEKFNEILRNLIQ